MGMEHPNVSGSHDTWEMIERLRHINPKGGKSERTKLLSSSAGLARGRSWGFQQAEVGNGGKSPEGQIGAQRKGFLLLGAASLCWGKLKAHFRQNQAGHHRETVIGILLSLQVKWRDLQGPLQLSFCTSHLNSVIHSDFWLKRKACAVCLACLPYLLLQKLSSLSFIVNYLLSTIVGNTVWYVLL